MNLMGKIFTLLILILSIAFLVVAVMVGASHRNWKQAAETASARAQGLENQIAAAKTTSTEKEKLLQAERVSRAFQIAQLVSQLSVAKKNRDAVQTQLREELVISQQRLENLKKAEQRLGELDQTVAQLKAQNTKLIDDVAKGKTQVVTKTNELYRVEGQKAELEKLHRQLQSEFAVKTRVMKAMGIRDDALTSHIEPKVEGYVTNIRDNVIVISLGGDDGIRKDHLVDIFRRNQYVGKAKVLRAKDDFSTARILPEYLTGKVREGDNVTTKL